MRCLQLIVAVCMAWVVAYAQDCAEFSLKAKTSNAQTSKGDPFFVEVILSNKSDRTVTVFSPQMPTVWSAYEKPGSQWVAVWSHGVGRGTGSAGSAMDSVANADKLQRHEYVKLAPGEVLRKKLDLTEDLWDGKKMPPFTYKTNRVKIQVVYDYEPRSYESSLPMLKCRLTAETKEITLLNKKSE